MATSFDLPANPANGQEALLPSGVKVVWNGSAWVFAGTSFDIDAYVKKAGDTMTGPLKLADGAVAAPSLAFASELGLGWYRRAAGTVSLAQGGVEVFRLDNTGAAGASNVFSLPRLANGGAAFTAYLNPAGSASNCTLAIGMGSGTAYIGSSASGGAAAKNLNIDAPWLQLNAPVGIKSSAASANLYLYRAAGGVAMIGGVKDNIQTWGLYLGEGSDYFTIARYDAAGTWVHNPVQIRTDGIVQIGQNANSFVGFRNGGLDLTGQAVLPDWSATMMCVARGTGWASWNGAAGWPIIQTSGPSGDKAIWWLRHAADGDGYTGAIGAYGRTANAVIRMALPGCFFDFYTSGSAQKPGGGSWVDNSDERIKDNITDYASGLAEVLALRPRTFTYKAETGRDPTRVYTGLIAQEAEQAMPELVSTGHYVLGEFDFDDMRQLDNTPLVYALVNATKELAARNESLEGTVSDLMDRVLVLEGAA